MIMEVNVGIPQGPVKFMSPAWRDLFKHVVSEAERCGIEVTLMSGPGWSGSGGPWVTPAQAMKKYVWSEMRVEGGRPFTGTLPKPPSTTGPYQNIAGGRGGPGGGSGPTAQSPEFYADSAVAAYRAPESDRTLAELQAKVTSSGGTFDLAAGNVSFGGNPTDCQARCGHCNRFCNRQVKTRIPPVFAIIAESEKIKARTPHSTIESAISA